jgi:hypothetical protein
MIRWDQPLGLDLSLAMALEMPDADMTLPAGATTLNQVPDLVLSLRYNPEHADVRLSGIYRRLKGKGNGFNDSVNAWGVQLSGNLDSFGRDSIQFGVVYGNGLGAYIQDTQGYGLDAAPTYSGAPFLTAVPAFAAWAGYQHFWTGTIQSNISYGFVQIEPTAAQAGDTYRNTTYASLNLIWSMLRFVDVGIEYIYGERNTKDKGYGNNHRLQCSATFSF